MDRLARRSGAPASPFPPSRPIATRQSISPTGLPAARCSVDPMPRPAVSPAMRTPGTMKRSMPERRIFISATRTTLEGCMGASAPQRLHGLSAGTLRTASIRGLLKGHEARNVVDDLNRTVPAEFCRAENPSRTDWRICPAAAISPGADADSRFGNSRRIVGLDFGSAGRPARVG